MKVNVEVIMTPEEYEEAKRIQKENSDYYDTLEFLVFEWVETDFANYTDKFEIKVEEAEDNG